MSRSSPDMPTDSRHRCRVKTASGFLVSPDFMAVLVTRTVFVDGEKVGVSKPGGYFHVDRPAGNHVVTCESPRINECRIVLEPGSASMSDSLGPRTCG